MMARTKQTQRKSTGSKSCYRPPCYESSYNRKPQIRASRSRSYTLRSLPRNQDTGSSTITVNFQTPKDFPFFAKFPREIQSRVWEILAEEPRIVIVNTKTDGGLHSSIPPILHVCSESRAVALKHYTLAFASQPIPIWEAPSLEFNQVQEIVLPPRVYFNFERDTLYFRENWNRGVQGAWSCIMQFGDLLNESDLKRVKGVGFDVNARVCSLRSSGHYPIFAGWDSLETLYLGFEGVKLGSHCLIGFRELERKDYSAFMRRYRKNPCWRSMQSWPEDVEAVEQLRTDVPTMYQGYWEKPDRFLEKLVLVSIVQL